MLGLDTGYDLWRVGNILLNLLAFIWLCGGLKRQRQQWNTKTRDLWYSRMMWAIAGMAISIEGIAFSRNSTFTLIFVTAASLISFKALNTKGSWGYEA